jgi:long-chain acyl-CoA synthetase
MNWLSMAHGAFTQSCVVVTAYDTLGVEGLRWSLQQTKPKAIFVDPNLLPILNVVLKDATTIACVILNSMSNENQDDIYKLLCEFPHTQIISYTEFKELGMDNPAGHVAPTPDDLACIMYTSGTSDMPKGVTIKHRAIVASVAGATSIVGEYIGPDDRLLAYLPQAHIIEFIFENASLFWGATIGFGSPRTLTESSVRNCKGDLLEFCPTILVGVPAVWESIRKSIVGRVNESGLFARTLFWAAMTAKETLLGAKFPMPKVLDALVFDKVRAATGGRLRICMSGGGPLSRDTQQYISTTICPLIIGYGLTETAGMGALNDPRALTFNAHGDIPASVEEKLIDFPEAGYFTSNDPPQGELCIRGPSVTTGYYENDQETKLVLGEDGWFKTGDIAEFDKHGHVKIIDRKKNLIKTLNGEYIALERLEALYSMSPLVANICIHAAEDRSRPIAIIVPVEAALLKLAIEHGIQDCDFEALIDSGRLDSIILKEIQRTGRQGQLASFEIVEGIVLDKDEWTPKNVSLYANNFLRVTHE